MKKKIAILCLVAAALFAVSCGNNASRKQNSQTEAQTDMSEPEFEIVTTMGTIKVKLYNGTPKHRDNFRKLVSEGFYDGLLFHRVIKDFMIQTGDPLTLDEANAAYFGMGGPGYNVPAEINPDYYHKKGALAAARRGDAANPLRESSGSQFYIVHNEFTCGGLDGQYTVFGETVEGLDVIDAIASVETNNRDCPLVPVKIITIKAVDDFGTAIATEESE